MIQATFGVDNQIPNLTINKQMLPVPN
jgi:hypothetical protein